MRWSQASIVLALLLAACESTNGSVQQTPTDASAPDAGEAGSATSVTFDESGTLTLLPGETRELGVTVEPAGTHNVRFALLGTSLDASLNADQVATDPSGRAVVRLTAALSATTFRIRATADDGPFDEVAVSVSADGFATVLVRPQGYTGHRATPLWTASALARTTCASLTGNPPADGPIVAQAPDGSAVKLEGLPVGPTVAVTLRAGKSVSGCSDVKDLAAAEERAVTVLVADTPIDIESTNVAYRMALSTDMTALRAAIDGDSAHFVEALLPSDKSMASTLLDEMEALAPDPADMASARSAGDWDQLAGAMLDASGVDLREQLSHWVEKGLAKLWAGELVDGRLAAQGAGEGHAILTLSRLGGLDAGEVGVPAETLVSLVAAPKDTVQLGGNLMWFPSQLVASAADEGARHLAPPATNGREALASGFQCAGLPAQLTAIASLPSSCDAACMQSLCESAVAALWALGRNASADQLQAASLVFTVSAAADVAPDATVAAIDGAWAGTYSSDTKSVDLKGTVSASSQP